MWPSGSFHQVTLVSRRELRDNNKPLLWREGKFSLEQILVVVANIQARYLKTEVGKGSLGTVFVQGLAGP